MSRARKLVDAIPPQLLWKMAFQLGMTAIWMKLLTTVKMVTVVRMLMVVWAGEDGEDGQSKHALKHR